MDANINGALAQEDKGLVIVATAWSTTAVALLLMGLRFWAKVARSEGGLWWDDYILLVSWVCMYATALVNSIMVSLGSGKHIFAVDPSRLGDLTLLANVAGTTSILAAQLSKTSFGMTLLRIATDRLTRVLVWFAIVTINLAMTANLLSQWFQCNPPAKVWIPMLPGDCWRAEQSIMSIVMAAYSGAIDIMLVLVPWKIVLSLQMRLPEKIGIASAMSLGVFAGVAACVKAAYIPGLAAGDFTFAASELLIYSYLEIGLSIIAASIPALRVLVRDKIRSTRKGYSNGTQPTQQSRLDTTQETQKYVLQGGQIHRRDSFSVSYV
ncbi:hypothetical protein MCOR27_004010 [Pyricularia oryzae]|nr:hypothetical protein MCOR01_011388 [Pyricularia oryzae]KAI6281910.1 hypothetical protein MCOR27_004010 [Pyricularia oryzae]KAI6392950.1 hypothetical protein MCOR20_010967 [Pyricularia oryzae]KAI6510499.1 hypothetical protein MCOR10_010329 [Pyricularia oryzae]KAI6596572.1 hypothetical protein MCOR12_006049 [Pyricularia oryzae]